MEKRYIILTFDVEEFDIPLEYDQGVDVQKQLHTSYEGLILLQNLLNTYEIPATFFCTGVFAEAYPDVIRTLSHTHEIASHTFFHSTFDDRDLERSKNTLEHIIEKEIQGLRMPRMQFVENTLVKKAGYSYNASLNPTLIPGRYNNLSKPKLPFREGGIWTIPATVSPSFRIPLFWLTFKNFPLWFFKKLSSDSLRAYKVINLYFHPWEFVDLSDFSNIPSFIKRFSDKKMLEMLEKYIIWAKNKNIEFITMADWIQQLSSSQNK